MEWQPKSRREARAWIREYWAEFIFRSDMQAIYNDEVIAIWEDENRKIANRLIKSTGKEWIKL